MATLQATPHRLNSLQISLLRLFNRDMSDDEILSLKRILVKHYSAELKTEIEKIVSEKGYTQTDFDAMLNQPS